MKPRPAHEGEAPEGVFDHYLKGAPKPEWMEKGIPARPREGTPPLVTPVIESGNE